MRKLFQWYWEELLAKVTGKGRWGQGIRCHGTISEHTYPDGRGKCVSSSDEAMVLLCLENGEQRFRYCLECETGEKKTKVDAYHPRYQTRWSSSNSGQNKCGGWSETGRARFTNLCKKISSAKKKPHVKALEIYTLRNVQAGKKIKSANAQDPTLGRMEFAANTDGYVAGWEGSDQETEGEGQDSELEDLDDTYLPPAKRKKKAGDEGKEAGTK